MKYSSEKFEDIAKLIRAGVPAVHASIASDIDESTYYDWLKQHQEFQALIKKAESERLATLVVAIRKDTSWQSKAWLLERLYNELFGSPGTRELYNRITAIEQRLGEVKS